MKSRRPPDFFIVGHPKTGTTALFEALCRHPRIFKPPHKEPMFFAPDIACPPYSEKAYYSLFRPAAGDQLIGDGSVWYLASRQAAHLIYNANPQAKIIAIFREPVDFLRSLYLQMRLAHAETAPDFGSALGLEAARRASRQYQDGYPRTRKNRVRELMYSDHVHYVDQLRRYHELFPPDNVMVIIYDDFKRDNLGVIRSVLRFLRLDDSVSVEVTTPNPGVRVRSGTPFQVHKYVHQVKRGEGVAGNLLKPVVKAMTTSRVRTRMISTSDRLLLSQPESVDPALRDTLKLRFAPEVRAFSAYLQRDLVALWNYDEIVEASDVTEA